MCAAAIALSGCASLPIGREPRTAVERAMQNCLGTVVGGAVVGALFGAALGGGNNVAKGAIIGGAAGTVACAALVAMANEEDKARIAEIERVSAAEGKGRIDTYARAGVTRKVETRVYEYKTSASLGGPPPASSNKPAKKSEKPVTTGSVGGGAPASTERVCRYVETSVEVSGQGTATADKQLYCRTAAGDWEPAAA